MEVRFLPPERGQTAIPVAASRRGARLPASPASRNMEVLRPLDARLAENTKNARTLAAEVLAAGKGKRLKSSTPKVLHPICGRPALWHVLQGVLATKRTRSSYRRARRRRRPIGGHVPWSEACAGLRRAVRATGRRSSDPSPASRNMEALRPLDARLAETTKNARTLAAVVLAAGKGKRLKSSTPKVLHPICGRPALWHVLQGVLATRRTRSSWSSGTAPTTSARRSRPGG